MGASMKWGEMIINDIQMRSSVRTYDSSIKPDFGSLKRAIEQINNTTGPFGHKITVTLVSSSEDSSEMKLGTYGMIKGASDYLVVTIPDQTDCWLDLGFLFEQLVLEATSMGLGTVWMAGTFSRKHFKDAINLSPDQIIPIVSPVGIASEKKSFVTKYIAKSKTHVRKPFEELFYDSYLNRLELNEASAPHNALEMVRLAPSAMNKQPWRVVEDGNSYHFYDAADSDKSKIDIGIAICHFVKTLEVLNITYKFVDRKQTRLNNYIISVVINH